MMKRFLIIALCTLTTSGVLADKPAGYTFVAFDKAMQQAHASDKPIFVYFGRYGCGYCDKTNKEAFSNDRVRELYSKHYVLAYVDAESGKRLRLPSGERITEREVGTRYDAFVTPVFTFMTTNGEPLHRMIGVQRVEDLLAADKLIQQKLNNTRTVLSYWI